MACCPRWFSATSSPLWAFWGRHRPLGFCFGAQVSVLLPGAVAHVLGPLGLNGFLQRSVGVSGGSLPPQLLVGCFGRHPPPWWCWSCLGSSRLGWPSASPSTPLDFRGASSPPRVWFGCSGWHFPSWWHRPCPGSSRPRRPSPTLSTLWPFRGASLLPWFLVGCSGRHPPPW